MPQNSGHYKMQLVWSCLHEFIYLYRCQVKRLSVLTLINKSKKYGIYDDIIN